MNAIKLPNQGPGIDEDDLRYFCALIEERAGIALKQTKHDLIKARLRARLDHHGLESYGEYRKLLEGLKKNDPEWETFVNLLTTNKTDFFREPAHFRFLTQQILPSWLASGQKIFRVWSAASSTGEEPYTLALVLRQHLPAGHDFHITATDIDTEVLKAARNAVYSNVKRPEIPPEYHNFIEAGHNEARGWFRIKRELKEKITFGQHNLISREIPGEGYDLVLCRNVLIYFGHENIDFVQAKLRTATKPGGHLFIGHSESLQGLKHSWKMVGPSVFRKG
jgi:chemotaxis methyl-accepting protein methylase